MCCNDKPKIIKKYKELAKDTTLYFHKKSRFQKEKVISKLLIPTDEVFNKIEIIFLEKNVSIDLRDLLLNIYFYSSVLHELMINKIKAIENFDKLDLNTMMKIESSIPHLYNVGHKISNFIIKKKSEKYCKFLKKYRETRNKIFEHNLEPTGYLCKIEPNTFSIYDRYTEIQIIINDKDSNNRYIGYLDYYADNERLLRIISRFLEQIINYKKTNKQLTI